MLPAVLKLHCRKLFMKLQQYNAYLLEKQQAFLYTGYDKKTRPANFQIFYRAVHRYFLHRIFCADDADPLEVY